MSNLKKLIRERQVKTGESYQTAHRYVTGAHAAASSFTPPENRRVYAREDVLRCAKLAPDRTVAIFGANHREEAHISYERISTKAGVNAPLPVVGAEFVTLTAILAGGVPAWQFIGRVDALWGGPEPEGLEELAKWLKEDVQADALTVRAFMGNVAEITAHWIAKERTGNKAAFEALADELMGRDEGPPVVIPAQEAGDATSDANVATPLLAAQRAALAALGLGDADAKSLIAGAQALNAAVVASSAPLLEAAQALGERLRGPALVAAQALGNLQEQLRPYEPVIEKLVDRFGHLGEALLNALHDAGMPFDELQKWDGELLGLKRISGGASAVYAVAQAQATENERIGAYALDIGNMAISVPREKGESLRDFLIENGIEFERARSLGAEWVAKEARRAKSNRG
ncbi:MAG: hypothetical protein ABI488_10485 [Polyangiaceae bacterium]